MTLSDKKLSLIGRLMMVRRQTTLEEVENILVRAEMESRAEESLEAIAKGDFVTLEEFSEGNSAWLRKNELAKSVQVTDFFPTTMRPDRMLNPD